MNRSLLLLCAVSLSTALLVIGATGPRPAPLPVLEPAQPGLNCKPDAPIRIELSPRNLIGGRAQVDYRLTPVMDALAIEVSVRFPQGGNLRWHTAPANTPTARGVERRGSLSVDLPLDRPGVEVEIRAHISIPDPDAPDGIGVYTTSRTASWGEVERIIGEVTEVVSDNQLTLDTAVTRY